MALRPASEDYVQLGASAIFAAYERYNTNFNRITRRARQRFEKRDWRGAQQDHVERIDLYTKLIDRLIEQLRRELELRFEDRDLWRAIKHYYKRHVEGYPDAEFAKTFFSSVTRRIFDIRGTDQDIEFLAEEMEPTTHLTRPVDSTIYINWSSTPKMLEKVLEDYSFKVKWRHPAGAVEFIDDKLRSGTQKYGGADAILRLEFIKPLFYQSTRAYVVGKAIGDNWMLPVVISLKNDGAGIEIDDVIFSEDDISTIFGFTRSYFFVDLETVGSAVSFLKTLLPRKPLGELYTALGRARQGKTERYRILSRHLQNTHDKFIHAAGDKGLVMLVFTLPSYGLVFKLIRDRFGYPKESKREQVIQKYQLVFKHDRAGRLIDTQEFRQIKFPLARFDAPLLEELLGETADICHVDGDTLTIDHLYVERRLRPLNLYLKEVERPEAELAILDYGQAIRDLALTNIFPGDLLLKNFGVTRHGRVIFYDYDELCLVTDCRFRELPDTDDTMDEMRGEQWFYVGEDDVFPEQFLKFLAMDRELKALFLKVHGDLLTADFWREIQRKHEAREMTEVLPYYRPLDAQQQAEADS